MLRLIVLCVVATFGFNVQAQQSVALPPGQSVQVTCLAAGIHPTAATGPGNAVTVSCSSEGGGSIFAVELFPVANCAGAARWGVRSRASCSDSNRPDFYTYSAKITDVNGRALCVGFDRLEEDEACRRAYDNYDPAGNLVEMFTDAACVGAPRWTATSVRSCSDSSRPDFYCSSIRVTAPSGASVCLPTGRVEEDVCCRQGFER